MKITSKIADSLRPLIGKLRKHLRVDTGDKAGLYLTLIFHLAVIIVLLCWSIHTQLTRDTSFVIDFSQLEEQEALEAREQMKQSVSEEIDAELDALLGASGRQNRQTVRNVAVDASEPLRDDRHENPEDIYRDARDLQKRLDKARQEIEEAAAGDDGADVFKEGSNPETEAYQGPSVISYALEGRKAMSLPVPAYKCMGGGDVSVSIIVNRKGYVTGARIIESVSSPDQCLRDYALRAASRSRFTASQDASERQAGEIVYRFVAQ